MLQGTQLLTLGPKETPYAGIKQQKPISCHYCSMIRSIWTLALALHHLPQHSQCLTSQPASNWSEAHFTSGHIDGYWAWVPFSSPDILNYTLAMCSMCTPMQGQTPHQSSHFHRWWNLAMSQALKHDTLGKVVPAQMQILLENKWVCNFQFFFCTAKDI